MFEVPHQIRAYHDSGQALRRELSVQPWICELWPIDKLQQYNEEYEVRRYAPGYVGFGSSGGGEMFAISPVGSIVCLAFIGMDAAEALPVASSWSALERKLGNEL